MKANILHPRLAVESAFDRPDLPLGLLLVLAPPVVGLLAAAVLGFAVQWPLALVGLAKTVSVWLASGVIVYVLALLVGGKTVNGKLPGILSGLSLVSMIGIIATVLGILVLVTSDPVIVSLLRQASQPGLSADQSQVIGQQLAASLSGSGFSPVMAFGLFGLGILLAALGLFLVYLVVSDLLPKSKLLTKIVVWLVALLVWANVAFLVFWI